MLEQKVLLQVLDSQQEASMDTFQSDMQCIQFQKAETWVNNWGGFLHNLAFQPLFLVVASVYRCGNVPK